MKKEKKRNSHLYPKEGDSKLTETNRKLKDMNRKLLKENKKLKEENKQLKILADNNLKLIGEMTEFSKLEDLIKWVIKKLVEYKNTKML